MTTRIDPRDEEIAEELREWLTGFETGRYRPVDVEKRRDENQSGEDAWFFEVKLPNPTAEEGTWAVDDINRLAIALRDRALERGLPWPWHVRFVPEHDEPQDGDDEDPPAV